MTANVVGTIGDGQANSRRVTYLLGAGASHACGEAVGSDRGLLMRDIRGEILTRLGDKARSGTDKVLRRLVNSVLQQDPNIEQVITFLETSGSYEHEAVAHDIRQTFAEVLQESLNEVMEDLKEHPNLYAALLDLHVALSKAGVERLMGFMTLNYDDLLESAVTSAVDYGAVVNGVTPARDDLVTVLKLHGALNWSRTWPIRRATADDEMLWIAPGISKDKTEYPFNLIWGKARELLDCDLLRIVGCNLSTNDWDLISLLFAAKHTRDQKLDVEIIDKTSAAHRIKEQLPFLEAKSLLEVEDIGPQLILEVTGEDAEFSELPKKKQKELVMDADRELENPFASWLKRMRERLDRDDVPINPRGPFDLVTEKQS